MQDRDQLDEILSAVMALELVRNARRVSASEAGGAAALEGEILVEGQWVTLQLVLDASFPLRLPRFYLRPWDALGFIPHVSLNGFVCFADSEGLVLNRRRPVQVVQEAFQRVMCVLTKGVTGENRADFADEFDVYWKQLDDGVVVPSMLDPGHEMRRVIVATDRGKQSYIAASERELSAFRNGLHVGGTLSLQRALYLPLEPGTVITPPRADHSFWAADEARIALLGGLSPANRLRLNKLMKRRVRRREYVIVSLPRPSGGATMFGIRYDEVGKRHPLLEGGTARRLVPLHLERLDQSYLVPRGGGNADLAEKRVLLVGCGAVGGHLAFELARGGVLDLTLIDPDVLTSENSFRHVLGRRYWGEPKVEALKTEIEIQLPYVRVRALRQYVEALLMDGSIHFGDYDLVIVALGNPTVELELNELLHAQDDAPPVLFTWLEPLGIGGHVLLTGNASGGGCFECLYTPPDEGEAVLENRAAFAAHGQSFGRALTGCGSLHTPYGSVDATRTANLATGVALDTLTGKEARNPLLSWKGSATTFQSAGYRLSARYHASEAELFRHRYVYQSSRCPVCRDRLGDER